MNAYQKPVPSSLIALYAWILTIFFGMVLLDIIYANLVPEAKAAFSAVSDFFLLVGFATLLLAAAAIAFSWANGAARNLLIASLFVLLLEFAIPIFLSPFIRAAQGLAIGPWLRIIPTGAASLLALLGMQQYARMTG
jgi:hypothetical protein